jgi:peptidoglycan lytic transglycosylase
MRMRRTIGLSLALLFASAPAMAKEIHPVHHHPHTGAKSKSTAASAERGRSRKRHHRSNIRLAAHLRAPHHQHHHHRGSPPSVASDAPPDEYIGPLRVVGAREVGYAAWYGGRHLGRRTASGERLDSVHATAAHRSLPLYTLVRVTNLRNGRSVIATINDRGPVSHRLLIDVSPSAAEELHMIHSGIAKVAVEPVVETPNAGNKR